VIRTKKVTLNALLGFCAIMLNLMIIDKLNLRPVSGKVVLSLRYRSLLSKLQKNPYTIGMFFGEHGQEYFGTLIGTDWDGCIYIFDPIDWNLWTLKRFDRQGRFQEAWNPIRAFCGINAVVTKDGYIWLGIGWVPFDRLRGFPIIAYLKGKKEPAIDWRKELPKHVMKIRDKLLSEVGIDLEKRWEEKEKTAAHPTDWSVEEMSCSPNQVAFSLGLSGLGADNFLARLLWILCSSDGREIFEACISSRAWFWFLGYDGNFWIKQVEREFNIFTPWKRIWLFKRGEDEGEPLVDLGEKKPNWIKILLSEQRKLQFSPIINVDAKGNIYLIWQKAPTRPYQRIIVEGEDVKITAPTIDLGESALVVLDKNRRFLTYLPWQPTYLKLPPNWVKPLPDGSGFYRIEYREREAVIYFHPLPSQKR
jgi:hypothetical protein